MGLHPCFTITSPVLLGHRIQTSFIWSDPALSFGFLSSKREANVLSHKMFRRIKWDNYKAPGSTWILRLEAPVPPQLLPPKFLGGRQHPVLTSTLWSGRLACLLVDFIWLPITLDSMIFLHPGIFKIGFNGFNDLHVFLVFSFASPGTDFFFCFWHLFTSRDLNLLHQKSKRNFF